MDSENPEDAPVRPLVVDLGKRRGKQIKQLKQGEGPLAAEIAGVVEQVKAELAGDELAGKTLLPLVVIYRKKKKRRTTPATTLTLPFNNQT